ncbi:DUF1822 family protein [Calothrix sp. PCC 7507]|uniref:DUF1822 family protein n=1 Tax=Calothrix sp. PCC 7507 TaxID=99598 RepID=UPI00029F3B22|nr:DUF1822 family protein [Calothrix sp. PCC 7507]AFY36402.1 protein of unknown function DUF1822 [Calothrix sp. PCC 7507]
MTFLSDISTQLEFPISTALSQQSWQQSQSQSTAKAQWNNYLNQICLQTFLPWLQAEYAPQASVWLNETLLPNFWSVVNGTALIWGNKRLILLPDKSLDSSELRIPQEWVDIPAWLGDYYLAVQINPEELIMRVWGYTTHKEIKRIGSYDHSDRSYSLDAQEIIPDINVLWVVSQLNPDEPTRFPVPHLSPIAATQAENLLQRLANLEIIQPRLELPFHLWGALISDEHWLHSLYQLRQGELSNDITTIKIATNLSQWLQNTFEASWQSVETLLGRDASLGFSFRQISAQNEAIIKRVKSLSLPNQEVFLVLGLDTETDGRIGIRIQLRSQSQDEYLPLELSLNLLSSSGQIIQSIQSRMTDNLMQLKRFKSNVGTQFSIQIEVNNFVITENFVI